MARKNSTTETPVADESVSTPSESVETPAPEAEAVIDLTAFQTVVNAAVATRDAQTGVIGEDELKSVTTEYRSLEGVKPKNAAKSWVEEQMMEAVGNLDGQLARAYSLAKESLTAGSGGTKAPAKPADPVAAFVQQVAVLNLARLVVNASAPEVEGDRDVNAEVETLVNENTEALAAYLAWEKSEAEDKGDAPEISAVARQAIKAASGKGGGGRKAAFTGEKGDVAKHVAEYFSDKEVGHTAKVSEIANFKSAEYPNGNASQGAISARLFPGEGKTTTLQGVEAVERDDTAPRRARKIA